MFFKIIEYQPDLSVNFFQKNTEKVIIRFTATLILSATLGLYFSNTQAADISCTWAGGPGNWTDPNWNSNSGCSGTFPNNNGKTFDATLRTSFGAVNLDRDIAIQTFNFNGGTLTGTNNLTVNKAFNWTRGTLSGTGIVNAKGGLELSGGLKDILSGWKLMNSQVANWTGGSIRMFGTSQLVNEAGASFNITMDGGRMSGSSDARFINAGNLLVDLSNPLENVQLDSPRLNNSGIVGVKTGELRLGGGGTHTGSFQVGPNGRLNFSGGTHTLEAGSSVSGSNVDFSFKDSGGTTTIEGAYNVENTTILGNAAIFNAANNITGTLTQKGGFLGGSGDVIVMGKTTLSGGVVQGPGRLITVGGLEINGSFMTIVGNRRVLNVGVANWTSGGIALNNTATRFENAVGATFNIKGNATRIQGQGALLGGTGEQGLFVNRGDIRVELSDDANTVVIHTPVANLGNIHLQGDKLALGDSLLQFDTGALLFDIGGAEAGEFDVLNISVNAILGGIIGITLVDLLDPVGNSNPYNPTHGETFDILTANQIILQDGFSLGGQDAGSFEFNIVSLDTGKQTFQLRVVPIPATVWLFISGLFGIWRFGIRKSR